MNGATQIIGPTAMAQGRACLWAALVLALVGCEDAEPPAEASAESPLAIEEAPAATPDPPQPAEEPKPPPTDQDPESGLEPPMWVAKPQPDLRTTRSVTVFLEEGEPRSTAAAIAAELDGTLNDELGDMGVYRIQLSDVTRDEARAAAERARQTAGVRRASGGGALGRLNL